MAEIQLAFQALRPSGVTWRVFAPAAFARNGFTTGSMLRLRLLAALLAARPRQASDDIQRDSNRAMIDR